MFQIDFHCYSIDFKQVVFVVAFRIFVRQICIISKSDPEIDFKAVLEG